MDGADFIDAIVLASNNLAEAVMFLGYTANRPGSNLSWNTDYPEEGCVWVSLDPSGKFQVVI
jgi:hypothetical protein